MCAGNGSRRFEDMTWEVLRMPPQLERSGPYWCQTDACHSRRVPGQDPNWKAPWWRQDRETLDHDDVIKWKQFPRYWPFVRGIHRSPVNSPHKGQWRGALMFSLICVWINGWVNNREAGNSRRYRVHYDVTVLITRIFVRGLHRSPVESPHKRPISLQIDSSHKMPVNAELCCFRYCYFKQAVEYIVECMVWDAMMHTWRHCDWMFTSPSFKLLIHLSSTTLLGGIKAAYDGIKETGVSILVTGDIHKSETIFTGLLPETGKLD